MKTKKIVKDLLKSSGIEIQRYPGQILKKRAQLIDSQGINLVLDAGANIGQYAKLMREIGYEGKIISFEPLSQAYQALSESASKDRLWEARHMALGDSDGTVEINISGGNTTSSSILEMMDSHVESKPEAAYVGKEEVPIHKLDSIYSDFASDQDKVLLKIDTQGFEKQVLEGARNSLKLIQGVQLEMSLVPLYQGEMLYYEMIGFLRELGFELYYVEPGFTDKKTGRLLQMDGIFFRS